ncbi:hypothetical protein CK203_097821 [Vitis vinifera]|uniref:Uncharacterized protein n=1 Tax=Vitis vinifera TaxID=29760 RepID=A0A438DFQ7_VITVI|nr:hypothetical protein CK203_097821 [Vitis vinifera]
MDGHVILNTQGVLDSAVYLQKASGQGVRTHLRWFVAMVSVGALSSYEWLSETMVTRCGPWLLVVIAYYPDVYALPASFTLPWIGEAETSFCLSLRRNRSSSSELYLVRTSLPTVIPLVAFAGSLNLILVWLCGKKWLQKKLFHLPGVSEVGEKTIDKLDVKEFRERFCIPNDVSIDLVNEEAAMPTEKGEENVILFTKEQFNAGLRFPLPAFVQGIPPLLSSSTHLHSSQPCPGADGMQHHQHAVQPRPYATGSVLSLSLKKAKNDIFSVSAHLPSLQVVTELPDSTKGGAKGWCGPGWMGGLPERAGHLVDWVEKASFACVCKLFEIDPKERAYKTLLSARNLIAVVRESQEYVINILPRKLSKDEIVPGEHYTVKELPLYQEAKEADAERRRKLLEDRDQRKNEGTIRKAPDRSGVRILLQRKLQQKGGNW